MDFRQGHGLLGVTLVVAFAAACGGGAAGGMGGMSGAAAGAAGGVTGAAGLGGGAGSGAGGAAASDWSSCVVMPAPLRTSGTLLELTIDPMLGGQPFVYGEPNRLGAEVTGTVTPLNFRLYISEVRLLTAAGGSVPVDVVTAARLPEPYDVHLFNAEDESSRVLRVLAPPGTYTGVEFILGLNDACNTSSMAGRKPPLTDTSQMTWGRSSATCSCATKRCCHRLERARDAGAVAPASDSHGRDSGEAVCSRHPRRGIAVRSSGRDPSPAAFGRDGTDLRGRHHAGRRHDRPAVRTTRSINGERLRKNAPAPAPVHAWSVMTARACGPALAFAVALAAAGCDGGGAAPAPMPLVDDKLPAGFPAGSPATLAPADNALTEARAQLGKRLFFDKQLSRTRAVACVTCHLPEHAFSDPKPVSAGVDDRARDAQRARAGEPGVG